MKTKTWLILITYIALTLLVSSIGLTSGLFTDTEQSTDNALIMSTGLVTLLDDGFEGTPWDANWDGNGITDWSHVSSTTHTGNWAVECEPGDTYLTTDNLDASGATSITISFWFNIKNLAKGPLYVQIYNGTSYNTLHDLCTYPGAAKNTYCYYNETITDSQYFRTDLRLRFDGSGSSTNNYIDDVLITIYEQW